MSRVDRWVTNIVLVGCLCFLAVEAGRWAYYAVVTALAGGK